MMSGNSGASDDASALVQNGGGGYLEIGSLLRGRYEIRSEIGRGGMSVVYEAIDRELESVVAVKLLVPPPASAEIARERMRREVQAVRALRHPSIVRVYDVLEDGHWTFIIMERVEGGDLQNRVANQGALSPDEAARLGIQIAEALAVAHRSGVLHRDVKPHNLLLDANGRALLTDFGSARIEGQATLTQTGGTVGTLSYMAPEVLDGQRADARADVFALGMTLYYALVGKLPEGSSANLPAAPAAEGHHPGAINDEVPVWLNAAIASATCADPSLRFQTAASFAETLGAVQNPEAPSVVRSMPRPERCLMCGEPEPLGLAVCPRCVKGAETLADTYVGLAPSKSRAEVLERIDALRALDDSAGEAELRDVALGRKPLIRVPSANASAVSNELARRGLDARIASATDVWHFVPRSFKSLVLGVLACGWLAPTAAGFWLGVAGTCVSAVMVVLALRFAGRPLIDPEQRESTLPASLEASVISTMTELAPGAARNLLADVVHWSRDCLESLSHQTVLTAQISNLTLAGCDAARELDWLDRTLERLGRQRAGVGEVPERWMDEFARCERARDSLVQHLLESTAALGAARANGSQTADGVDEHLAELTQEIESEVAIQAEAAKEVAEFVDGVALSA